MGKQDAGRKISQIFHPIWWCVWKNRLILAIFIFLTFIPSPRVNRENGKGEKWEKEKIQFRV
jgi:hypothetical protein